MKVMYISDFFQLICDECLKRNGMSPYDLPHRDVQEACLKMRA